MLCNTIIRTRANTRKRTDTHALTGSAREDHRLILAAPAGSIDASELGALCAQLGFTLSKRQLRKALEEMDADGSGEVSFDEFSDWWIAAGLGKGHMKRSGKLWEAFCDIDSDDSGAIDAQELRQLTALLGLGARAFY